MMTKIGEMLQAWVMIYKSVVQSVLLYGINSWVVTGYMLKLIWGYIIRN